MDMNRFCVDVRVQKMLVGCFDNWLILFYGSCHTDGAGCEGLVFLWGVKGDCTMVMPG